MGKWRASVSVELALALPVLVYLLFGVLEFAPLARDYLTCLNAAREGARAASVGYPTDSIISRVQAAATGLDLNNLTITLEYRVQLADGSWSQWMPLGDVVVGTRVTNNAPPGAQVRATVAYNHRLMTGLFNYLADDPQNHTVEIGARVVMTREGGGAQW